MASSPVESSIPTPPSTPSRSPTPNKAFLSAPSKAPSSNETIETLTVRIDGLLIQYLDFLHTYTNTTNALNVSMRAGFLDLARANTSSVGGRGYGMRYGVEGFDARPGRMASGWGVRRAEKGLLKPGEKGESEGGKGEGLRVQVERKRGGNVKADEAGRERKGDDEKMSSEDGSGNEALQTEIQALNLDDEEKDQDKAPPTAPSKPKAKTKAGIKDPIHQLGGLVPPSLRTAQKAFREVVGEYAPQIVNAREEMERLEGEVREWRQHLKEREEGGRDRSAAEVEESLHKDRTG